MNINKFFEKVGLNFFKGNHWKVNIDTVNFLADNMSIAVVYLKNAPENRIKGGINSLDTYKAWRYIRLKARELKFLEDITETRFNLLRPYIEWRWFLKMPQKSNLWKLLLRGLNDSPMSYKQQGKGFFQLLGAHAHKLTKHMIRLYETNWLYGDYFFINSLARHKDAEELLLELLPKFRFGNVMASPALKKVVLALLKKNLDAEDGLKPLHIERLLHLGLFTRDEVFANLELFKRYRVPAIKISLLFNLGYADLL